MTALTAHDALDPLSLCARGTGIYVLPVICRHLPSFLEKQEAEMIPSERKRHYCEDCGDPAEFRTDEGDWYCEYDYNKLMDEWAKRGLDERP